jgi:hypothetical protein
MACVDEAFIIYNTKPTKGSKTLAEFNSLQQQIMLNTEKETTAKLNNLD